MDLKELILQQTAVYRLWQAPFTLAKLAPVFAQNNLKEVRRVLDVGCGPGINTSTFAHTDYLGIDINPKYINYARARYARSFVAADVCTYEFKNDRFDFILVNSFLHHLDDTATDKILSRLATLLSPGGYVHILELVQPETAGVARLLAAMDRGHYARRLNRWRELIATHFKIVHFQPYSLRGLGITLWNMLYCKAHAPTT